MKYGRRGSSKDRNILINTICSNIYIHMTHLGNKLRYSFITLTFIANT